MRRVGALSRRARPRRRRRRCDVVRHRAPGARHAQVEHHVVALLREDDPAAPRRGARRTRGGAARRIRQRHEGQAPKQDAEDHAPEGLRQTDNPGESRRRHTGPLPRRFAEAATNPPGA